MAIQGMNHFTILTDDVEATRAFYCDLLDLHVGWRPPFTFPGLWLYSGERSHHHPARSRPLTSAASRTSQHRIALRPLNGNAAPSAGPACAYRTCATQKARLTPGFRHASTAPKTTRVREYWPPACPWDLW